MNKYIASKIIKLYSVFLLPLVIMVQLQVINSIGPLATIIANLAKLVSLHFANTVYAKRNAHLILNFLWPPWGRGAKNAHG